ncbi:MAG: prenyltransferase [Planctomycetota bacterium]|nr:MAG: prenyltransferase [Planctomycetota bacterium]
MRGISLLTVLLVGGVLLVNSAALSQEDMTTPETEAVPGRTEVSKELRRQVTKGIDCLVTAQDPKLGCFGSSNKLATTSLAGMALLSGGHLPGRGKYCKNVDEAINFILNHAFSASGYIQYEGSNMYSHGFAALFLAEVYGSIPPYKQFQPKVRKALKKSVKLLEKCQSPEGGWWYNPTRTGGADISVTVCETNALRAARNCGIAVDKRVIQKALKCVKRAANPNGGFSYRVNMGGVSGGSNFERSAGAVCILQALGAYKSKESQKGLDYLLTFKITSPGTKTWSRFYYYGAYYSAQAMFMAGDKYWNQWWPGLRDQLLSLQRPSGFFDTVGRGGPAYSTAVALIVLQMPYRYLPIYQEGIENGAKSSQ